MLEAMTTTGDWPSGFAQAVQAGSSELQYWGPIGDAGLCDHVAAGGVMVGGPDAATALGAATAANRVNANAMTPKRTRLVDRPVITTPLATWMNNARLLRP